MNIILFGFKRSGKTYFGMKVAQKLHREFIDSDYLIEEIYAKSYLEPLSYREIVKKHGFAFFRDLEKHAISSIIQKRNCVISLGGGVVLNPENVSRLQEVGKMVYLKTPKNVLKQRFFSHDLPAYIDPLHPETSFEELYKERIAIYEAIPSHVVDTKDKKEEEIIQEICAVLLKSKPFSCG